MTPPEWRRRIGWCLRTGITIALIGYVATLIQLRDSVELDSGARVEGRLLEVTEQSVVLETSDGSVQRWSSGDLVSGSTSRAVRRGIVSIVRAATPKYLVLGLASIAVIHWLTIWRLIVLLRSQAIDVPLAAGARWHFVGLFYTSFLPGITGGDFVKIYYLVQRFRDRKAASVATVFLDRVIGTIALAIVGGIAILVSYGDPLQRPAAGVVGSFLGASIVGGCLFFSRRARRVLRFERLLAMLPFSRLFRRLDEALFLFRYRKRALVASLLLAIGCHGIGIVMNFLFGKALGLDEVGLARYFVVIPTILILSSIPVSIGGMGWGEAMYLHFFTAIAPTGSAEIGGKAVALSLTSRVAQVLWSLVGGAFLLTGRGRVPQHAEARLGEPVG